MYKIFSPLRCCHCLKDTSDRFVILSRSIQLAFESHQDETDRFTNAIRWKRLLYDCKIEQIGLRLL